MVVKVVKAEPDSKIVKEVVCQTCGCTLQYVPNDVKTYQASYYYDGSNDTEYYIDCANPECSNRVFVGRY